MPYPVRNNPVYSEGCLRLDRPGQASGEPTPMRYLRAAVWISGLAFVTQPQRLDHGIGGGQKLPAKRARQEPVISPTACL